MKVKEKSIVIKDDEIIIDLEKFRKKLAVIHQSFFQDDKKISIQQKSGIMTKKKGLKVISFNPSWIKERLRR